jgi:hypothetical protein
VIGFAECVIVASTLVKRYPRAAAGAATVAELTAEPSHATTGTRNEA